MLWPIVLPLKITVGLLVGIVAVATASAPLLKWKRTQTFLISTIIAVLAFVPTCVAVKSVVDSHRFGVSDVPEFADVDDARVERYLPPAARSITLDKSPMGYRARFTITQAELDQWLDGVWAQFSQDSIVRRRDENLKQKVGREFTGAIFEGLDWKIPDDLFEYEGPIAANGAGFTIWYDAQTETAFQRGGYW